MGRKRDLHTSRTAPEWKKQVDQTLWAYSRAERALAYQQALIAEMESSALSKRTAEWESRGNGTLRAPQDQLLLELEQSRERDRMLSRTKENVEQILDWVFPEGTEERQFVEAYWLTSSSTEVQVRVGCVIRALPFLGDQTENGGWHGNRNFYYWRNRIYQELGEGLGYLPDYESMVFSREL